MATDRRRMGHTISEKDVETALFAVSGILFFAGINGVILAALLGPGLTQVVNTSGNAVAVVLLLVGLTPSILGAVLIPRLLRRAH